MATDSAMQLILRSQILLQDAIQLVKLALNNNPAPSDELALRDQLSDLETAKDELVNMEIQLDNASISIPPPERALMQSVKDLTSQVETERIAGAAAATSIAVAGEAFNFALTVMSLA
jgi:hypothetical protein